jgi:hypothetical protein
LGWELPLGQIWRTATKSAKPPLGFLFRVDFVRKRSERLLSPNSVEKLLLQAQKVTI